jgi:tRNA A-37 threonylcarbamoyl transferase component Bud32
MTNKATKTNKAVGSSGGSSSNKANKSVEYTAKDLLVLAQAFIRTSENSIDGVSQKRSTFWEEVTKCFHKLKESQHMIEDRRRRRVTQKLGFVMIFN